MCCAPCSVYPVSVLQQENIEIHGFFYNPNIHPKEEFLRRKENVDKFSLLKGIPVYCSDDFLQEKWENFKGAEDDRCTMCYSIRMEKAALFAKENGFDAFTTSLLVSPYQKHDLIKEIGMYYAKKHGVDFYYRDFRPGFRNGQQQAKELGLYRQKFCGCIISFNQSPHNK
jgi:predicted adenine nucleotide alpha hydrolase (AANH) superfamily ATPase